MVIKVSDIHVEVAIMQQQIANIRETIANEDKRKSKMEDDIEFIKSKLESQQHFFAGAVWLAAGLVSIVSLGISWFKN